MTFDEFIEADAKLIKGIELIDAILDELESMDPELREKNAAQRRKNKLRLEAIRRRHEDLEIDELNRLHSK